MKKLTLSMISILVLAITHSCTEPQTLRENSPESVSVSVDRLARIDNMLQQAIDSGWIAGATGFIARDGNIVYDRSFGYSDIDTKKPLRNDDLFRIASQTKAITSVAVMTLFEEGKFLLDDPVSKYIPEFAHPRVLETYNASDTTYTTVPAKREITIRDLLTHTSGIDYAGIGSKDMVAIYAKANIPAGFGTDKMVLGDRIKVLAKLPLVHQPGEKFTYGLNIDVLGYLVEILSGESLDHYFQEHIFEPLGMNDTYFYIPEAKADRLVKVSTYDKDHRLTDSSDPLTDYPLLKGTYFSGGAGLTSTIHDYGIFLQMLLNNGIYNGKRILARRTVELMTCNQIGDLSLGADKFGLGFEITTKAGQARLGVSEGSFAWGGYFSTIYWVDPQELLVCELYMQQFPLHHPEIQDKFRAMVYQALSD